VTAPEWAAAPASSAPPLAVARRRHNTASRVGRAGAGGVAITGVGDEVDRTADGGVAGRRAHAAAPTRRRAKKGTACRAALLAAAIAGQPRAEMVRAGMRVCVCVCVWMEGVGVGVDGFPARRPPAQQKRPLPGKSKKSE